MIFTVDPAYYDHFLTFLCVSAFCFTSSHIKQRTTTLYLRSFIKYDPTYTSVYCWNGPRFCWSELDQISSGILLEIHENASFYMYLFLSFSFIARPLWSCLCLSYSLRLILLVLQSFSTLQFMSVFWKTHLVPLTLEI